MEHHSISRKRKVSCLNLCRDLQYGNAAAYVNTVNNAYENGHRDFLRPLRYLDQSVQMYSTFDNNTSLRMLDS